MAQKPQSLMQSDVRGYFIYQTQAHPEDKCVIQPGWFSFGFSCPSENLGTWCLGTV